MNEIANSTNLIYCFCPVRCGAKNEVPCTNMTKIKNSHRYLLGVIHIFDLNTTVYSCIIRNVTKGMVFIIYNQHDV